MMAVEKGNSIQFLDNLRVFFLFIFSAPYLFFFRNSTPYSEVQFRFSKGEGGGGGLGRPWSPISALARENGDTITIDRLLQVFIISKKRFVCC